MSGFTRAVRSRRKLRAAFDGPSGAGKTFTALRLAFALLKAGMASRVAVIDSENESASLYAGEAPDGTPWEFGTLPLKQFGPDQYTAAIQLAFKSGYDVCVVDSLSHAWNAEGGALDIVDRKGGNKFTAWKDVTPMHRRMVDTIINAAGHVIVTMRSKTEYVLEADERGRSVPRKVGTAPIQRDGMEYEFDVYGSLDVTHQIRISKSRCSVIDGLTGMNPGPVFWQPLFDWLNGAAATVTAAFAEPPPPITKDQLEQLASLKGSLIAARGLKDDADKNAAWAEVLIPFGVGSAKQLTRDQANKLIAELNGRVLTAAVVVSATSLPNGEATATPAVVVSDPKDPKDPKDEFAITDDQLREVFRLRELLMAGRGIADAATARGVWSEILQPFGVTSAKELTVNKAAELIAKLGPQVDPFGHPTSPASPQPTAT